MTRDTETSDVHSAPATTVDETIIQVRDLQKHYPITEGVLQRETGRIRAVDGVSFEVTRGETFGLVGESGCGKSTVARTVLGLEPATAGTVELFGEPIADRTRREQKRLRRQVQMVFQDPTSSFDPRMTMAESIAEPMFAHGLRDDQRRGERVETLLELVGLSPVKGEQYPHELSGGEKQRVALARALSLDPDLLILDEPMSALDASVQAEILTLIDELQQTLGLTVLLISHNLRVVEFLCDRVAVMYLGEVVESQPVCALFEEPKHPYTRALLSAIPRPELTDTTTMVGLSGDVPDPSSPPPGCRFHTRCQSAIPPAGLDVPQASWQAILSFRVALRDGQFDTSHLTQRQTSASSTSEGTGSLTTSELCAEIRREYDLPSSLDDEDANAALESAITNAVQGDHATAATVLAQAFPTVCIDSAPTEYRIVERSGRVRCHLYEDEYHTDSDE